MRSECDVVIDLHPSFLQKKSRPVNVRFTLNRYPFRQFHHAVNVRRRLPEILLFPTLENYPSNPRDERRFRWNTPFENVEIENLNQYQSDAAYQARV